MRVEKMDHFVCSNIWECGEDFYVFADREPTHCPYCKHEDLIHDQEVDAVIESKK